MEMERTKALRLVWVLVALATAAATTAVAQQITGVPGSPGATTTISGKQLPPPDPKFGGVIKDDALRLRTLAGKSGCGRPRARAGYSGMPRAEERRRMRAGAVSRIRAVVRRRAVFPPDAAPPPPRSLR